MDVVLSGLLRFLFVERDKARIDASFQPQPLHPLPYRVCCFDSIGHERLRKR
jgi:hypothetical protein